MTRQKTTGQYIEEAAAVHSGRYDYSRVEYQNNKSIVEIGCPVHGFFTQRAGHHLAGHGCLLCAAQDRANKRPVGRGAGRRITLEVFLKDATKRHGGAYDYSLVKFQRGSDRVTIICPKHGQFSQTAEGHLAGFGCKKCGVDRTSSRRSDKARDEFVATARKVHGDKYNYDCVEYQSSDRPVEIACPTHGLFRQSPCSHIAGRGCPQCGSQRRALARRRDEGELVQAMTALHRGRYTYRADSLQGVNHPMEIVCPDHGVFQQSPNNHLKGQGCPQCKRTRIGDALRKRPEAVIADFRKVHGSKYDYSRVVYENADTPVEIVCFRHGVFKQAPFNHLSGRGCPGCKESSGEAMVAATLFELEIEFMREWRDHDCIPNQRPASFDFYLPRLKTIIEFDGPQHFIPVKFGGMDDASAQRAYEETLRRDSAKNVWAEANGLKLIRIRFTEDPRKRICEELGDLLSSE